MRGEPREELTIACGMLVFTFGRILGVHVKGQVRCQMKDLPEFRINIEGISWGTVFCAWDAPVILANSLC